MKDGVEIIRNLFRGFYAMRRVFTVRKTRRITVTNLTDGFECSPKIFKRVCTKYIILTIHRLGEASFTSYED